MRRILPSTPVASSMCSTSALAPLRKPFGPHVETIGDTLTEIFNRSDRSERPTGEIANELAEERFKKHTVGASLAPERLARTG
jgi:hypothetical protein